MRWLLRAFGSGGRRGRGWWGLWDISAAEELDDLVVEVRSLLVAFVRARHIPHQNFDAQFGRANADRGPCRERPRPADISQARPLLFGKMGVCFGFLGP